MVANVLGRGYDTKEILSDSAMPASSLATAIACDRPLRCAHKSSVQIESSGYQNRKPTCAATIERIPQPVDKLVTKGVNSKPNSTLSYRLHLLHRQVASTRDLLCGRSQQGAAKHNRTNFKIHVCNVTDAASALTNEFTVDAIKHVIELLLISLRDGVRTLMPKHTTYSEMECTQTS